MQLQKIAAGKTAAKHRIREWFSQKRYTEGHFTRWGWGRELRKGENNGLEQEVNSIAKKVGLEKTPIIFVEYDGIALSNGRIEKAVDGTFFGKMAWGRNKPSGFVAVGQKFWDFSQEERRVLIAHELSHIKMNHTFLSYYADMLLNVAASFAIPYALPMLAPLPGYAKEIRSVGGNLLAAPLNFWMEYAADGMAVRATNDPEAAISSLSKMRAETRERLGQFWAGARDVGFGMPGRLKMFLDVLGDYILPIAHPWVCSRIKYIEKIARDMQAEKKQYQ